MKGFLRLNNRIYLGLLLVLILLFVVDFKVRSDTKTPIILGESNVSLVDYPILRANIIPQVSAKGVIVMDADSGIVLYSKNPNFRFSSASTTKIMTALTALNHFKLDDILTVKDASSEGVVLGLKTGQRITFENLLYALLLPSANDTAITIAQNYPSDFVRKMNENVVKFNLLNTHYEDPAGLADEGDYTTPLDLAHLAAIALKNETFARVVSTKQKTIADLNGNYYPLKNLNKLLGFDGVDGVKTGYTEGAGQVLVASKEEKGHRIIIVVMGSEDRFLDTQKLLSVLSGNITYLPIHP